MKIIMKRITGYMALAVALLSIAACNKAKFMDTTILSFTTKSVLFPEDGGIVKIPVQLYGADECVLTYSVTAVTAKEGENYVVVDRFGKPDNTGVLTVSNVDKAVNDSIRIQIVDLTGIETGNLTIKIALKEAADEKINLGGFNSCICTIIDNDGGLSKLIGSYEGSGVDTKGEEVAFNFDLEEYDPTQDPEAYYTDADCMITNARMLFANGNDMDFQVPIYGYFDKDMSKIHIYGLQPFNAYDFGGDHGVCLVAWGIDQYNNTDDITLTAGDGVLVLDSPIGIWLMNDDSGDVIKARAGTLAEGYKWTKK